MDRLQIAAIAVAVALLAVSYLFRLPPAPPDVAPTSQQQQEGKAEPPSTPLEHRRRSPTPAAAESERPARASGKSRDARE